MSLPNELQTEIEQISGVKIKGGAAVGGGSICNARRLELSDGRQMLVKWRARPTEGMFTVEGRGLERLRATETLRIPEVFAYAEADGDRPAYLLMEWLGRGSSTRDTAVDLGRGLAAMHQHTAAQYGLDYDNYIGANPQPNQQHANWVDFFREQRLGFQRDLAARKGYLNQQRGQLLEQLLSRLDEYLPAEPPASLLHGDLWGGNWLVSSGGEPALIDPAVYYGHREAELAFTELFGGFSSTFYAAYNEAWPLDDGYETRKDLYNLYHLLNHLNLFGESYGSGVDSILRRYA